jgi:hypothetical protein
MLNVVKVELPCIAMPSRYALKYHARRGFDIEMAGSG